MESKLKTILIYVFGSQILLGAIAICTFLTEGAFAGYVQIWGINRVVGAVVLLELSGIGLVYLIRRDAKLIRDERDDLIELKSYRTSFHIQNLAFLGLLLGNALSPARSPVHVVVIVIIIAAFSRGLASMYYRRLM